uniref:Ubiquitin-like domain-containing protein n=1 Tax=Spongospora subterranea TaxID=70186 RepID=A0A0H5R6V7_9EUKA|eukprot:CRZ09566.1 hypothetical protein [Spongospora subterranea]
MECSNVNVVLCNAFGGHPDISLQVDHNTKVNQLLDLLKHQHNIECASLIYDGRLLMSEESVSQLSANSGQYLKLTTFISPKRDNFSPVSNAFSTGFAMEPPVNNQNVRPGVADQPHVVVPQENVFAARFRRIINLQLAGKLLFFVFLLGGDGTSFRREMLFSIAVAYYFYHVIFRARQAGGVDQIAGNPAAGAGLQQPRDAPRTEQLLQDTGLIQGVEKFIVGLFASLYPGWNPQQ